MRQKTFHWEIKTILTMFEQAFNDIVIDRYNIDKVSEDQIHVDFKYMPKTRTLFDLVQLNQHIKMPIISIVPNGIRRDQKRVFNKIEGSYHTNSPINSAWRHLLQPVPVNLGINMSIIGRFQQDIDQILTNFIPYNDPYVVVSSKWPDIIPWSDFEIRSHIIWGEDVSYEFPVDIAKELPYRVIANTTFTIETWMFKNSPWLEKPIYIIDHSFSSMDDMYTYEAMKQMENIDNTEVKVVSARPQFTECNPFVLYTSAMKEFSIYGYMLDYANTFYLSANSPTMFDTDTIGIPFASGYSINAGVTSITSEGGWREFDYFSALSGLSAYYPPFSGIQLSSSEWDIDSQNLITFSVSAWETGTFDVIAVNAAGYGVLTKDAVRPTLNPYPSALPEYFTYVQYQHPSVSGIQVYSV